MAGEALFASENMEFHRLDALKPDHSPGLLTWRAIRDAGDVPTNDTRRGTSNFYMFTATGSSPLVSKGWEEQMTVAQHPPSHFWISSTTNSG